MRTLSAIADPVFIKREFSSLDQFFIKYLKQERDLPFIYLMIKLSFLFITTAIVIFSIEVGTTLWWVLAIAYGVGLLIYTGPFTLMLHNTSHRPLLKGNINGGIV